jgi:sirohydrochlorin cobaltochelatase
VSRAIILLGHGSRDPLWRRPIEAVARRLQTAQPDVPVCCAFLELEPPDLESAAAQLIQPGVAQLSIVPMFLGTGKHAREDLPVMVDLLRGRYPAVRIDLRPPVGEDERLLDLLATLASE